MRRGMLFITVAIAVAVSARAQGQAVATICKDGSTTASMGKGTCSGHNGVDAKATSAAKKAAKSAAKSAEKAERSAARVAAQVTCTDGTMSKPGRGACSRHGGIAGSAAVTQQKTTPSLPATVPANSPARTRSQAKSRAPSATNATVASSRRGEDNDPADAIAQCKDGMYSHASNHRGACSRHGGVAKFLKP